MAIHFDHQNLEHKETEWNKEISGSKIPKNKIDAVDQIKGGNGTPENEISAKTNHGVDNANSKEGKSENKIADKTILAAGEAKREGGKSESNLPEKTILAVGGAKGGVGKSMLAANLAVGLALLGQQVVLADLDLGGSDVHLYVGVKSLSKTWNDFLDRKVSSIKEILTPTAFKGLTLIGGDSSKLGSANLPHSQKLKIMRHLKELECDYIIIDLGGNTTYNGLDFFLFADQKIVVTGTEPASILDSYSFVKVAFHRFLERYFAENNALKDLGEHIRDGSLEKSPMYSLNYLLGEVRRRDESAGAELTTLFDQFRISLVVNMAENGQDVRVAESMQKVLKEKCFLDVGILGAIPFDNAVRKAARQFTPIVVESSSCPACKVIHQMLAAILLHREQQSLRSELLQKTSLIRNEAKQKIDTGKMTLDGLTIAQVTSIYNRSPKLRDSFRKILNILKN